MPPNEPFSREQLIADLVHDGNLIQVVRLGLEATMHTRLSELNVFLEHNLTGLPADLQSELATTQAQLAAGIRKFTNRRGEDVEDIDAFARRLTRSGLIASMPMPAEQEVLDALKDSTSATLQLAGSVQRILEFVRTPPEFPAFVTSPEAQLLLADEPASIEAITAATLQLLPTIVGYLGLDPDLEPSLRRSTGAPKSLTSVDKTADTPVRIRTLDLTEEQQRAVQTSIAQWDSIGVIEAAIKQGRSDAKPRLTEVEAYAVATQNLRTPSPVIDEIADAYGQLGEALWMGFPSFVEAVRAGIEQLRENANDATRGEHVARERAELNRLAVAFADYPAGLERLNTVIEAFRSQPRVQEQLAAGGNHNDIVSSGTFEYTPIETAESRVASLTPSAAAAEVAEQAAETQTRLSKASALLVSAESAVGIDAAQRNGYLLISAHLVGHTAERDKATQRLEQAAAGSPPEHLETIADSLPPSTRPSRSHPKTLVEYMPSALRCRTTQRSRSCSRTIH